MTHITAPPLASPAQTKRHYPENPRQMNELSERGEGHLPFWDTLFPGMDKIF